MVFSTSQNPLKTKGFRMSQNQLKTNCFGTPQNHLETNGFRMLQNVMGGRTDSRRRSYRRIRGVRGGHPAGIRDFPPDADSCREEQKVDVLSSWVCSTVVGTHDGETFRRLETFCRHGDGIHASSPKTFHRSGYAAKRSHVVGFWS